VRGLTVVLAAGALLVLAGCSAARRIQVFTVSLENDTSQRVVVRDCDDYCTFSLLSFDLPPGASVPIHRTPNQHKLFSVTTPAGGRIGCVDLYFKTAQPDARVLVSQAAPCPAGSSGHWKIAGLIILAAIVLGAAFARASLRSRAPS
jgi:hypothetical protein